MRISVCGNCDIRNINRQEMLMASQSPPPPLLPLPSPTIQTLPSDQQQQRQREYRGATYTQKNSSHCRLRREKSMEFDDDINNNTAAIPSPATSSIDEDQQLVIPAPSPSRTSSPSIDLPMDEATSSPSVRRSVRPSVSRRVFGSTDHQSSIMLEPDPNVFLISSDTNSHNTIRKTKHDVKRFVMYIDEQFGEKQPLHTIAAESLCRYLKHYFENTKKFDGTQYEPDTLRSFLLSIERYLKSKHYEFNLMESPLFQSCRQVIVNKREQWRKMGGGNNSNNTTTTTNSNNSNSKQTTNSVLDTKNIHVFDRTKPDGLLLEMYVHLSKLGQDQLLNSSQLLWRDVELVDEYYLVCHQRKHENQLAKLFATPTQLSTCPVQAYRLYATHRPPQCNTPQSPFYLTPRASSIHHTWYKTSGAGKNLEQVLQRALQRTCEEKRTFSNLVTISKTIDAFQSPSLSDSNLFSPTTPLTTRIGLGLNNKRNELRNSSPAAKRIPDYFHTPLSLLQPLNLSVATPLTAEDDSGTASSSPTNSLSNEIAPSPVVGKSSPLLSSLSPPSHVPVWDENVTEILLTVAKQRDTRVAKINILRTYLEEKLGVVEFLCLYRGFKSEPKLTFHGTPWEHYQRFLPVLFTLLALDNTTL